MEIFELIGTAGFFFRLAYKLSGLIYLWWRKEYRFDRMAIHFRTRQGAVVWGGKVHAIIALFLVAWLVLPWKLILYPLLASFMVILGIGYTRKFRSWMLPPFSPKVLAILVGVLFFVIAFVVIVPMPILISLSIVDLLLFPLTAVFVGVVTIPTGLYHHLVISKATGMLRRHKKMIVIGITGSYGKTSVKEYVSVVLSKKYKTLKTPQSKNSPIGIAETIRQSLDPDHRAFVVEMGAYKRGEIRDMCAMVTPEIGVITAINPQHQDLFGSIETTMKAKYELVQGLTGRKLLIANADDPRVVSMGNRAKRDGCTVIWYSQKTHAKHIVSDDNGTRFDAVIDEDSAHVITRVIGKHQVSNILAALVTARACGITLDEAAKAAANITPATGVMEVKVGINGSVFIDDTFNNNPDAAKAAVAYLAKNKGKKIIVFQPMIELGAYADRSHEEVGRAAAAVADAILLTNSNWFTAFERGVRNVSKTVALMVTDPIQAASYIRTRVGKGDMVLFKGKDAGHTLDALTRTS